MELNKCPIFEWFSIYDHVDYPWKKKQLLVIILTIIISVNSRYWSQSSMVRMGRNGWKEENLVMRISTTTRSSEEQKKNSMKWFIVRPRWLWHLTELVLCSSVMYAFVSHFMWFRLTHFRRSHIHGNMAHFEANGMFSFWVISLLAEETDMITAIAAIALITETNCRLECERPEHLPTIHSWAEQDQQSANIFRFDWDTPHS